jgi:hypothetical protein
MRKLFDRRPHRAKNRAPFPIVMVAAFAMVAPACQPHFRTLFSTEARLFNFSVEPIDPLSNSTCI